MRSGEVSYQTVDHYVVGSNVDDSGSLSYSYTNPVAGLRWQLDRQTRGDLGPYAQLIQLPTPAAHVTITLP